MFAEIACIDERIAKHHREIEITSAETRGILDRLKAWHEAGK